jgi:hypothetical protein
MTKVDKTIPSLGRSLDMLLGVGREIQEGYEKIDSAGTATFVYAPEHAPGVELQISYKVNFQARVVLVEQRTSGGKVLFNPGALDDLITRILRNQGIIAYEGSSDVRSEPFAEEAWTVLVNFAGMLLSAQAKVIRDGVICIELYPPR